MGAYELAIVGLAGSSVGSAVAVPMLWPQADRSRDVRLLGSAVLLMSALAALISARLAGLAPEVLTVEHTINVIGLGTFPLVVLYSRHAIGAGLNPRIGLLWTPAVIYIGLVTVRAAMGLDTRVPFSFILPVAIGFTAMSAMTLWRHPQPRRQTVVPAHWIVGFCASVNAAQLIRMELAHVAPVRALVPLVLSVGFVLIAGYAVWRTVAGISAPAAPARPRYEHSGVDQVLAEHLLTQIEEALTRDRLFARSDLTLPHLATVVGATPHQVSEVLNRCAGVSFHDLISRRRVEDVKAQLREAASDGFTIEGIGASAGFGSRSALYAAFRRHEGTTPTAFRLSASSAVRGERTEP